MDNKARAFVYAFLSRVFSKELGKKEIEDLKNNPELLVTIGNDTLDYFQNSDTQTIQDELNIDYSSLFLVNSQPVESLVVDSTGEILVGLQNPVMFFYFENGYEIDMNQTEILAPDHLAIEFGFMQNLAYRNEDKIAKKFLQQHILAWVPPYLVAIQDVAQTPFYKDICDFTIDYLLSDYEMLKEEVSDAV
ncbi:molecular chaperone [Nitratiruptor sp. YY09-18]|uniref:TorD/DmsD family molecular chaperone n=1 Tax=Nitratiruptor sp. YY09-18 TaxID=2724901 RepID=UPI001915D04C|nr:molecular chaperone TorD family protein [Nitratiruptor sp. YY09-18]BCD68900.1 putative dimethyl sulfoxide reductase chaperone [Nitratiruptor sp. YY09-18]